METIKKNTEYLKETLRTLPIYWEYIARSQNMSSLDRQDLPCLIDEDIPYKAVYCRCYVRALVHTEM